MQGGENEGEAGLFKLFVPYLLGPKMQLFQVIFNNILE